MAYQDDFVREMWPYAVEIGDAYGIDPVTILTQAVQETGWGRDVAGNNYFGVKSHGRSGGQSVTTHEDINGQVIKITDSFRKYGSMKESVEDYARFLHENPRYGKALQAKGYQNQLAELAAAGYATDRDYGTKLQAVANSVVRRLGPIPPVNVGNSNVATLLDLQQLGGRVAPTPAPRSQGNAARVKAVLSGNPTGQKQAPTPAMKSSMRAAQVQQALGLTSERVLLPELGKKIAPIPATIDERVTARNNEAIRRGQLKSSANIAAQRNEQLGQRKASKAATQHQEAVAQAAKQAPTPATVGERQMARNRAAVMELANAAVVGTEMVDAIRSKAPMPASLEQRARAMDNAAEQAVARVVAPTPVRRSSTTQKQSGSNNKQPSTTMGGGGSRGYTEGTKTDWFKEVTGQ